jgi:hypothetical protein
MRIMGKILTSLLFIIIVAACKKSDKPFNELPPPTPTAIGVPDGPAVTKRIDAAGGTIVSADGMLELVIPAAALTTATDITLQPVVNQAPNGVGKAYRCLPDGLQFSKNISMRFKYHDSALAQTRKEFMRIAYQKPDRTWKDVESVVNDPSAKTITINTDHFTDYTIFNLFSLRPVLVYMRTGEQKQFTIEIARGLDLSTQINEQLRLLTDLNAHPLIWKVNGQAGGNAASGTVTGNRFSANYTAPPVAPPTSPISVSAEINLPYTIDGVRYNQFILSADVYITGKLYKVQIELERELGFAGSWKMSDKGEYIASINGFTVSVLGIQNSVPTLELIQSSPGCSNHGVTFFGVGDINIVSGDFTNGLSGGPDQEVYIFFNDSRQNQMPKLSAVCSGTPAAVDLGLSPSISGSVRFIDNGQVQVIDSGPGIARSRITVTPL